MPEGSGLCRRLPAARTEIDRFCQDLRDGLLAKLPQRERFAIELLVREALMNAVVHGAREQQGAHIDCEVELVGGGVQIRVFDRGAGFDWRAARTAARGPDDECGRGLQILDLYASGVRFSDPGNQVELTRTFLVEGCDDV